MQTADALHSLIARGIKPSVQRMAVMEYLLLHRTHPSADEIYEALHGSLPTLSKTTVYNTLRLLAEKGAAQQLTIDGHNVCFDADLTPHAHFLCTRCSKVYDVPLTETNLYAAASMPKGFRLDEAQLYFRGLCSACAAQAQPDN